MSSPSYQPWTDDLPIEKFSLRKLKIIFYGISKAIHINNIKKILVITYGTFKSNIRSSSSLQKYSSDKLTSIRLIG